MSRVLDGGLISQAVVVIAGSPCQGFVLDLFCGLDGIKLGGLKKAHQ
jgi:site-specific DNA-cytosine methylase